MTWRALRIWDVLSTSDLLHELEVHISDPEDLHAALDHGRRFDLLSLSSNGWCLTDSGPGESVQEERGVTSVSAGIYARGHIVYALLPEGAEFCVRSMLSRRTSATIHEIHEHLLDSRWTEISRSELLLWLAYFMDFEGVEGDWSLSENAGGGPMLREAKHQHARARVGAQGAVSRPSWNGAVRMGLPVSLVGPANPSAVRIPREVRRRGRFFTLHADDVLITLRGGAYHLDEDCRLLKMGWAKTFGDGKRPTGLRVVRLAKALKDGRHPCRGCA